MSDSLPIVREVASLRRAVAALRVEGGKPIGLVPTMGALHDGHMALVRAARDSGAQPVATLFVNPKQFERPDDLDIYPRGEAEDARMLAAEGCTLLFAPPVEVMYPEGFATSIHVGGVSEPMEGASRPGHFQGVATVVTKLLLQCLPDRAYFGEKDFQQLQTVRRMVRDLDIPVEIVGVPTVREADGLALSSRNRNLTAEQRRIAPELAQVLFELAERLARGERAAQALADGRQRLLDAGFERVDYLDLRDSAALAPLERAEGQPARLLAAAWLGRTRLIDNVPVNAVS